MPQAVAGWLISTVGATGLGAAAINAGVGLAFSIGLSKLTQPKGPSAQESQLEIRQSDAPRIRSSSTGSRAESSSRLMSELGV